jgi:uncharacterized membrane protein
MNKLARLWRHLTTTRASGKRMFPKSTLMDIQAAIAEGETMHKAEVRLIVEPSHDLSAILADVGPRQRAAELFGLYRIWDTERNCGILIYINLADHQVEIIADRGIAQLISGEHWQSICATMTTGFARGDFHDSAIAGIRQLNELLQQYLPEDQVPQKNQLSDQPILL